MVGEIALWVTGGMIGGALLTYSFMTMPPGPEEADEEWWRWLALREKVLLLPQRGVETTWATGVVHTLVRRADILDLIDEQLPGDHHTDTREPGTTRE